MVFDFRRGGAFTPSNKLLTLNDVEDDTSLAWQALRTGLVTKPAGIADGQTVQWDETTGTFLAVEPWGEGEISSAAKTDGVVTAISTAGGSGVVTDIPNCSVIVPASSRPVYINYGATIQLTTLGVGVFIAALYEGATPLQVAPVPLPGSISVGPNFAHSEKTFRVGPTVAQRTFKLRGYLWTNAGDDAAANVQNSSTSPSYIRAYAR